MTRTFGYLAATFWRHPKVRNLDDAARLFMTYLFSCPHGNSVGCFVLPLEYITADLKWSIESVASAIAACTDAQLIDYDDGLDLIRVRGWLNQNPPRNMNVALSMVRNVDALPPCEIRDSLVTSLRESDNKHIVEVADRLPGGTTDPQAKRKGNSKKPPLTAKQKARKELMNAHSHQKLAAALGDDGWSILMAAQNPNDTPERQKAVKLCLAAAKKHKIKWTPPAPA